MCTGDLLSKGSVTLVIWCAGKEWAGSETRWRDVQEEGREYLFQYNTKNSVCDSLIPRLFPLDTRGRKSLGRRLVWAISDTHPQNQRTVQWVWQGYTNPIPRTWLGNGARVVQEIQESTLLLARLPDTHSCMHTQTNLHPPTPRLTPNTHTHTFAAVKLSPAVLWKLCKVVVRERRRGSLCPTPHTLALRSLEQVSSHWLSWLQQAECTTPSWPEEKYRGVIEVPKLHVYGS